MQFSDYISLLALFVSVTSVGFATWFGLRDRAHVKAKCEFYPADTNEDGPLSPPGILIHIANYGRRPVYLEYLYFQYGKRGTAIYAETVWESDKYGRCRLDEGDKYEHFFDPDSDSIFTNDDGIRATSIFFQDSLGYRYNVKGASKSLDAYFAATQPNYEADQES